MHQTILQPVAGERDVWVYVVEFLEPVHVPKGSVVGVLHPRDVRVVVLLDGTAVAPAEGPWPSRR
ncbi:MAG: hypothetical protein ACM30E_03275 [Nitrososphaerales archaeon]